MITLDTSIPFSFCFPRTPDVSLMTISKVVRNSCTRIPVTSMTFADENYMTYMFVIKSRVSNVP